MSTRTALTFILFILTFTSCDYSKECPLCMTPPEPFYFEIVDKDNNENIFTSGLADPAELKLINVSDDAAMEFDFISENQINIIMINSIGWKTETIEAKLMIANTEVLILLVDAERKSEDCCDWTAYSNIEISNADFSFDHTTGVYTVYY